MSKLKTFEITELGLIVAIDSIETLLKLACPDWPDAERNGEVMERVLRRLKQLKEGRRNRRG